MIHVAPLRAAATAAGERMEISTEQLHVLLDEVEAGQRAQRELRMIGAVAGARGAGTGGVSAPIC